jgi:hypothetical protein
MLIDARWLSHVSITPQNPENWVSNNAEPPMKPDTLYPS